jgi:transcriptional regulator with XRE-family HTH domain
VTLGQQIRHYRTAAGLTLRELGTQTGYSVTYLSDVERDRVKPSGKMLVTVAEFFGVDVDLACRSAFRSITVPPSLTAFARRAGLTTEEKLMLANLRWRGKQPQTEGGWRFLWDAVRLVCVGTLEEQ